MHFSTVFTFIIALALPATSQLSGQATTTRYGGGSGSACGCGLDGNWQWQLGMGPGIYTAAGSPAIFDTANTGSSWCGAGCGSCYQLSSTGTSATGGAGAAGQSIIVMVTNLCPNSGNEQWCPATGSKNAYGFGYHFDIMAESIVFGDNIIVDFVQVACPAVTASNWSSCQCSSTVTPPTISKPDAPPSSSQQAPTSTTSTAESQPTDISSCEG